MDGVLYGVRDRPLVGDIGNEEETHEAMCTGIRRHRNAEMDKNKKQDFLQIVNRVGT